MTDCFIFHFYFLLLFFFGVFLKKNFKTYFPIRISSCVFYHPHFPIRSFPFACCHPHFPIRILSSAFYHPHFVILILSSACYYPPSTIRHPPPSGPRFTETPLKSSKNRFNWYNQFPYSQIYLINLRPFSLICV